MFTPVQIQQLETQLWQLVSKYTDVPRSIALRDTCSEVSRLVGLWILEKHPECSVFVYKGVDVLHTKQAHDVLFVTCEPADQGMILDPTVYQFFPEVEHMLVDTCDKEKLPGTLSSMYGGQWGYSEMLTPDAYQERQLEEVLRQSLLDA